MRVTLRIMRQRTVRNVAGIVSCAAALSLLAGCSSNTSNNGSAGPSDDARRELSVSADELLISSDITQVCSDIGMDQAMGRPVKAANVDDLRSFVDDYVTLMRENADVVFKGRSFKSHARSTASTLENCAPELAAKVRTAAKAM